MQCGTQKAIPDAHLSSLEVRDGDGSTRWIQAGAGIPNADLVVYVTGDESERTCQDSMTMAFAHSCQRDQHDRPVAGYIHFCTNYLPERSGSALEHGQVMLGVNEQESKKAKRLG